MLKQLTDLSLEYLPVITGVGGIGTGLALVIPLIFKMFKKYQESIDQLTRFIRLNEDYFNKPHVNDQFCKVVLSWDRATESTAKVCRILGMRKLSKFFSSIIKEHWYINDKWAK